MVEDKLAGNRPQGKDVDLPLYERQLFRHMGFSARSSGIFQERLGFEGASDLGYAMRIGSIDQRTLYKRIYSQEGHPRKGPCFLGSHFGSAKHTECSTDGTVCIPEVESGSW